MYPINQNTIPLSNGMSAIVDRAWAPALCLYEWHALRRRRCYYAYATLRWPQLTTKVSMSRLVAQTPTDRVCHHRNRNTLDNRRANLINMTRSDHELLHRNNSLIIKHDPDCPSQPLP